MSLLYSCSYHFPGGAGEGEQRLKPDGAAKNLNQVKTDASLPAYCNPPNPCPIGYTSKLSHISPSILQYVFPFPSNDVRVTKYLYPGAQGIMPYEPSGVANFLDKLRILRETS